MTDPEGVGVKPESRREMRPSGESVEVGMQPSFPIGVDLVPPCDASVRPYPAIVDPFKRRGALREYVIQLRGDNKENERVKEHEKSPVSLPKQKTLGLCRRHISATTIAVSGVQGEGMLRDKRKFNAPRQTPEKRQRPDQSNLSPGTELPRLEVLNQLVAEDVSEDRTGNMRQPLFQLASRENVELEPSMGQVTVGDDADASTGVRWSQLGGKDSYTPPVKRQPQEPKTPTIRRPLAPVSIPVNRQAIELHPSPIDQVPLKPNLSGGVERNGSSTSGSLFQTASGKPFQASAAAKARAALLFESDAELADFLDLA